MERRNEISALNGMLGRLKHGFTDKAGTVHPAVDREQAIKELGLAGYWDAGPEYRQIAIEFLNKMYPGPQLGTIPKLPPGGLDVGGPPSAYAIQ
jgi:hypothetical protein